MIIWYFFVLLNAFYGGALTMFFTSVASIPFENVRDVMRAYPEWNLLMLKGNEVNYVYQALNGDPDYAPFWERTKTRPDSSVVADIAQGVERLREGQFVLHVAIGNMKVRNVANFNLYNTKICCRISSTPGPISLIGS